VGKTLIWSTVRLSLLVAQGGAALWLQHLSVAKYRHRLSAMKNKSIAIGTKKP